MSEAFHVSTKALLIKAGFPDFPLDKDGFPLPGAVIRYYREHMIYIDPDDNKEKKWRQADLARRLGVSEVTVRFMETKNAGLDSLKRRRLLADILKIPPVLLGISTLSDFQGFLKQHQEKSGNALSTPATLKGSHIDNSTIQLYRDAFLVYGSLHSTSTAQDSLFDIEQWIGRIQEDAARAQSHQQPLIQRVLWDFHTLTAKIYADDLSDWNNAFNHLNIALELAGTLHSDDLYAASFYRSGQIRFAQRNFHLAKSDLDHAVQFAKKASPHLKGAVFAAAGLAHASVDTDSAGRKYAQALMEEAGKYTTNNNQLGGSAIEYIIKFNNGKYLAEKADALIMLGRPGVALHILDDAEEGTYPSETRRLAYIDILRAEAYMNLKAPQLDTATDLLASAFETSTSIKSEYNIGYITRLFNTLYRGPYAKSTKVADLGLSLRDWRKNSSKLSSSLPDR